MMKSNWNDDGIYSVQLEEAWTIDSVKAHLEKAELQSLKISIYSLQFAERNPGCQVTTEIDLRGITTIDASGWRVLTLWLEHLQHQGFNPVVVNQI